MKKKLIPPQALHPALFGLKAVLDIAQEADIPLSGRECQSIGVRIAREFRLAEGYKPLKGDHVSHFKASRVHSMAFYPAEYWPQIRKLCKAISGTIPDKGGPKGTDPR